jgi:hypothetical protein
VSNARFVGIIFSALITLTFGLGCLLYLIIMPAIRDRENSHIPPLTPAQKAAQIREQAKIHPLIDDSNIVAARAKLATFTVPPQYRIVSALDAGPSITLMIKPAYERRFFSIALQSAPPEDASGDVNDVAAWYLSTHRQLCRSTLVDRGVHPIRAKSQTVALHYLRCTLDGTTTEFGLAAFREAHGIVTLEATGAPESFDRGAVEALVASIQ